MNGSNERNPRLQSGRIKRIYARPGFAGLRNLDQDPERRLLLSTIFLFGEYFKPMQVIPMVLAAKCGNQPKKAEAATKKAAAAKA
jgi:hypothetical protein